MKYLFKIFDFFAKDVKLKEDKSKLLYCKIRTALGDQFVFLEKYIRD